MLASALTTFHSSSGAWGLSGKRASPSLANFSDCGGSDAARSCNLAISDASSRRSGAGGSTGFRGLGAAVGTGAGNGGGGSPTASVGADGVGSVMGSCVSDGAGTVRFAGLSSWANTPKTIASAIAAAPKTRRIAGLDTASWTIASPLAERNRRPRLLLEVGHQIARDGVGVGHAGLHGSRRHGLVARPDIPQHEWRCGEPCRRVHGVGLVKGNGHRASNNRFDLVEGCGTVLVIRTREIDHRLAREIRCDRSGDAREAAIGN